MTLSSHMMTWFDMYNEFIKNFEKINQLQKDYIGNLERINYVYNESIKNIGRINNLYNELISNYEKMNRLYEQQFDNIQRINQKWFDVFSKSLQQNQNEKSWRNFLSLWIITSFMIHLINNHVIFLLLITKSCITSLNLFNVRISINRLSLYIGL